MYLRNVGNSCYIDVILCALNIDGDDHKDPVLESIENSRKLGTCLPLRKVMKNIPLLSKFSGNQQHEAGEFLILLFQYLKRDNKSLCFESKFLTKNVKSPLGELIMSDCVHSGVQVLSDHSCVWPIDVFTLQKKPSWQTEELLETIQDSGQLDGAVTHSDNEKYYRSLTKKMMLHSSELVIWIQRIDSQKGLISNTSVYPQEKIVLPSGQRLFLHTIVIHNGNIKGGHYTAYTRGLSLFHWSFYDDLKQGDPRPVGKFEDMIQCSSPLPCPLTKSCLLFYFP